MTTPSIKKASTAEMETAIARALAELTGWETCTVDIKTTSYSAYGGITLELAAYFKNKRDPNMPF